MNEFNVFWIVMGAMVLGLIIMGGYSMHEGNQVRSVSCDQLPALVQYNGGVLILQCDENYTVQVTDSFPNRVEG